MVFVCFGVVDAAVVVWLTRLLLNRHKLCWSTWNLDPMIPLNLAFSRINMLGDWIGDHDVPHELWIPTGSLPVLHCMEVGPGWNGGRSWIPVVDLPPGGALLFAAPPYDLSSHVRRVASFLKFAKISDQ